MKQMRSRFRFLALVLVCAFLLTFAVCAGTVLKLSGVSLPSLPSLDVLRTVSPPAASYSPDPSASVPAESTPALPEVSPGPAVSPENDNPPDPEYNIFGL